MDTRLAAVELSDRDDHSARVVDVTAWPLTLGRALSSTVVLTDPHVAPQHVALDLDDAGQLRVQVASDSVNGVTVIGPGRRQRQHLAGGASASLPGHEATLRVGRTLVRVWLPGAALAPEQPLVETSSWRDTPWLAAFTVAALWAALRWLRADPDDAFMPWLTAALTALGLLLLWVSGWAMVSKLFRQGFDFWGHWRVALTVAGVGMALDSGLQVAGAALGWPWLWQLAHWVPALAIVTALTRHALRVLPAQRVSLRGAGLGLAAGMVVLGTARGYQHTDSIWPMPYMSTLLPPAMQWREPARVDDLLVDMQALKPSLDEAAQARDGGGEDEPVE